MPCRASALLSCIHCSPLQASQASRRDLMRMNPRLCARYQAKLDARRALSPQRARTALLSCRKGDSLKWPLLSQRVPGTWFSKSLLPAATSWNCALEMDLALPKRLRAASSSAVAAAAAFGAPAVPPLCRQAHHSRPAMPSRPQCS